MISCPICHYLTLNCLLFAGGCITAESEASVPSILKAVKDSTDLKLCLVDVSKGIPIV